MRIGSGWIKEKDGAKYIQGVIDPSCGVCLPAGAALQFAIRKIEEKKSSNSPDYSLEVWFPKPDDRPQDGHDAPKQGSGADQIPF